MVTDYDMPPHRGDDLLAIVAARWPRICRILHSGTPGVVGTVSALYIDHVVAKGDPGDLDAAIACCLPRLGHVR